MPENPPHIPSEIDAWLGRERRLSRILDDVGAGIFFLDQTGRFVHTNAAMCQRLLFAPGDLETKSALDLLEKADAQAMRQVLGHLVAGEKNTHRGQIRYRRKDGTIFWGDMSLSVIQKPTGGFETIIGVVIDISQQKQAEAAIKTGREKYRRVFDKSGAASIIIARDMTILMANEEFEKLTGYHRLEIENRMKWPAFIAPGDLEKMTRYHRLRRLPGKETPDEYECRLVRRSGELRNIFIKVGMLPDASQSIASFIDITSLKKTEQALRNSESRLLSIIEATQGWIYTCGSDFILEFVNRALADRIGKDAVGRRCYQAIYQRDSRCPWCSWEAVFSGQTSRREFENPRDHRWYDAMMAPIFDAAGNVSRLEVFVIDITERKNAEKMLKEQEIYLRRENIRLKSSIKDRFRFGDIIGKSPVMQQVYERILNAAATDANVIVYGESGTGKELVARAVHDMSERRKGAFVAVNCGAVPENLLESEFFGYKKGAFTGAEHNKHGYLDLSDGGTLFLDELGEIGLTLQVKLLRVIEGMGYRPVGSDRMHHPDVRIIAATNQDLTRLVRQGKMREDFFYRIHVIPIHLPPLRDRKEDIPLLMDYFLRQHGDSTSGSTGDSANDSTGLPPVTGKILDAAMAYDWPGNVRELQNVLYRYITLKQFDLTGATLKKKPAAPSLGRPAKEFNKTEPDHRILSGENLPEALETIEKKMISRALTDNQWHRGRAAQALGIHRRTLFKKIKKYKLECS